MTTALLPQLPEANALPGHQKIVVVVVAIGILAAVVELVRRRKLREEYAFLWCGTALLLIPLAFAPSLLFVFQQLIGAKTPESALFFGGLMYLLMVALLFSVRLSRLTIRAKALGREAALADREIEALRGRVSALEEELRELRRDRVSKAKGGAA